MLIPLPLAFTELLETVSLEVKHQMLAALTENINSTEAEPTLPPPSKVIPPLPEKSTDIYPSCYVHHVTDLGIDAILASGIEIELESLKLQSRAKNGKKPKVKTQWLSPSDESYNYGSVVNNPSPISKYTNICKLMDLVNRNSSITGDMDCAIISCFTTIKACLSLHSDDEDLISQNSSICTVSFGPPRTLDFVYKSDSDTRRTKKAADFSLPAPHHSMNVMKPGCQSVLKHRVPEGIHVPGVSNIPMYVTLTVSLLGRWYLTHPPTLPLIVF